MTAPSPAGASHGSTTAARFAKHQRVDRVVMFCGPRDQYETWQALPSVMPGGAAVKDAAGKFVHEDVWRYLFTHPVEQVGESVPHDPGCRLDLRRQP